MMPIAPSLPSPVRIWRPDLLLGLSIAVVFAASAFAPRANSAVLFLPLTDQAGPKALQWAVAHDARILGSSVFGGIVVDHPPANTFVTALKAGVLAISVPAAACTGRARSNR